METFYDLFLECAERWPQNIALEMQRRDRLESYTFADLRRMAESVGRWITESKFQPGSHLAILADNHPRWVAVYLGIISAGCTAVPLDTAFQAGQVTKLLKDSTTSVLFVDAKHLPVAREAVAEMDVAIVLTERRLGSVSESLGSENRETTATGQDFPDLDTIFAQGPGSFKPTAPAPDSVAGLLYTSGTTADPKGVMLTHANLMGEVAAVFGRLNIGPGDAVLGILPMFHVLAQMANLLLPLAKGARVVYLETLNTSELLRALREREITAFAVVPQFFYLIHERIFKEVAARGKFARLLVRTLMNLNRGLRRIGLNAGPLFFRKIHETFGKEMRYLITGGSRFADAVASDFQAFGIDVLNAYGLTETAAAAFLNPPGEVVIGSVGPALPGVEGKIVDSEPQGELQVGEIAVRGAIVMKGYWNRPEDTSTVLKDGWLLTGDLGYFDDAGNLFVTGRKKELIVLSNGKNIYPEEIEAHYLGSPFIKEICVMGLESRPDDPSSEHLHAVIVPDFDALKQRKIVNAKEVIRYDIEGYSTKLPSTKRIVSYEIWQEELPRTTTRKLKRFEIERRVRANQATGKLAGRDVSAKRTVTPEELSWLERPEVQRALTIVKGTARDDAVEITPSDSLELDLGLDSMQRIELLSSLEKQLGGDVPESQLAEIYTVRELVDSVLQSAANGKVAASAHPEFGGWKTILAEEPTDPEVLALAQRRPFSAAFLFLLSRLIQVVALDRFDLKVEGLERVPNRGSYIISSNHQSYLDPPVLAGLLPWSVFRRVFAVGTSDIFGSGFMRWLARVIRVVVVDPDANLVPAMRAGAFGLRHGKVLILYPEGERSIDGSPKIFKKGAAILSIHLQVPIIPVAIEGFYEAWPRAQKFQGCKPVKMAFGDPIYPPPEAEASEEAYEKLTAQVKAKVVEMWEGLGGKFNAEDAEDDEALSNLSSKH
jgi:long-chain acyl-CoA synthetase